MEPIILHHSLKLLVVKNVRKLCSDQADVLIVLRLIINPETVIPTRHVVTAIESIISQSVVKPIVKITKLQVKNWVIMKQVNLLM